MTVGELIKALSEWPDDLEVQLRAHCCPYTHDLKVEWQCVKDDSGEIGPTTVLIMDEDIQIFDTEAEMFEARRQAWVRLMGWQPEG